MGENGCLGSALREDRMSDANWRDEWPLFRVNLVDETARCLADQQSPPRVRRMREWETQFMTRIESEDIDD